jgi:hypothetical protein
MSKKSPQSLLESVIAIPFIILIVISAWVAVLTLAIKAMLLAVFALLLFITLSYVWRKCKERKAGQSDIGQDK